MNFFLHLPPPPPSARQLCDKPVASGVTDEAMARIHGTPEFHACYHAPRHKARLRELLAVFVLGLLGPLGTSADSVAIFRGQGLSPGAELLKKSSGDASATQAANRSPGETASCASSSGSSTTGSASSKTCQGPLFTEVFLSVILNKLLSVSGRTFVVLVCSLNGIAGQSLSTWGKQGEELAADSW